MKFRFDLRSFFVIAIAVVYLTLIPVLMVIYGSFRDGPPGAESAFTVQNYAKAFSNPNLYRSTLNSLVFALGGGSLAFTIGCLLAWITERTNTPWKGLIYAAVFTEIMIPGILESISLVLLYSPKIGLVNVYLASLFGLEAAPFNIYSMGGMIWAFGTGGFTTPFLLMAAAFRSMDPALEEAASRPLRSRPFWGCPPASRSWPPRSISPRERCRPTTISRPPSPWSIWRSPWADWRSIFAPLAIRKNMR